MKVINILVNATFSSPPVTSKHVTEVVSELSNSFVNKLKQKNMDHKATVLDYFFQGRAIWLYNTIYCGM
jgi:hypothetical protein